MALALAMVLAMVLRRGACKWSVSVSTAPSMGSRLLHQQSRRQLNRQRNTQLNGQLNRQSNKLLDKQSCELLCDWSILELTVTSLRLGT